MQNKISARAVALTVCLFDLRNDLPQITDQTRDIGVDHRNDAGKHRISEAEKIFGKRSLNFRLTLGRYVVSRKHRISVANDCREIFASFTRAYYTAR